MAAIPGGDSDVAVGECRVRVEERARRVVTTFPDGLELVAVPGETAEDVARARTLGYGGSDEQAVWEMTVDHDFAHSLLANAEGRPFSPTLHGVATGNPIPLADALVEEARVLLIQRVSNVGLGGLRGA